MLSAFAASGPHIDIKAETLFHLGPLPITNSVLLGVLGYALVIWMLFYTARTIKAGRSNRFTQLIMMIYEVLLTTAEQVVGERKVARKVAPLAITLFFFIIVNYWLGILPIVGPITVDGTPAFRGLLADMNVTFAMAIITMIVVQVYAIKAHGVFGNIGRYLRNPFKDAAGAFEGFLEIIAELSRGLALSLRLFGNVFAGEVLIVVIGYMTAYVSSVLLLPFFAFELFIGAIQAYVFYMLCVVFIGLGVVSHSHDDHEPVHAEKQLAGNG